MNLEVEGKWVVFGSWFFFWGGGEAILLGRDIEEDGENICGQTLVQDPAQAPILCTPLPPTCAFVSHKDWQ